MSSKRELLDDLHSRPADPAPHASRCPQTAGRCEKPVGHGGDHYTEYREPVWSHPVASQERPQPDQWETFTDGDGGLGVRERPSIDVLARKIADRMAQAYGLSTTRAADVAKACDESIDPSGNLLGWLRDYLRLSGPVGE